MIECLCCHLPRVQPPVGPTSHPPQICGGCSRHFGDIPSKTKAREKAHLEAWSSYFQTTRVHMQAEIDALTSRATEAEALAEDFRVALADATRMLADGFHKADVGPELRQLVETDLVQEERAKRKSAYRALAYANNALLDIADLHGESQGQCKCGKRARACKELAALAPQEQALFRWESWQMEQMRDGHEHGLREDHPKAWLSKANGHYWRGLPAREDRARR